MSALFVISVQSPDEVLRRLIAHLIRRIDVDQITEKTYQDTTLDLVDKVFQYFSGGVPHHANIESANVFEGVRAKRFGSQERLVRAEDEVLKLLLATGDLAQGSTTSYHCFRGCEIRVSTVTFAAIFRLPCVMRNT